MHELSVTENLLEITLRHANQAKAKRVNNIYLVVGQLSSIVDDSVKFYWDIISKDTIAQEATLHFKRVPARFKCRDCLEEYSPTGDELACPVCKGIHIIILAGEEFFVEAIDIE